MSGKSAAIILRQMHSLVTVRVEFTQNEVDKYDESIDFPLWMSTLSAEPKAISYAEQKRREAEYILSSGSRSKQATRYRLISSKQILRVYEFHFTNDEYSQSNHTMLAELVHSIYNKYS